MNADQLVKFSRQLGTSRPTNLVRDSVIRSHPSRGGSNGFPVTERQLLCNMWLLGLPVPRSRVRSIQRWLKNGVLPLRQTGNRGSSVIRGEHLFLLTVFKKIYPHASRSEGACFVASHSTDGRVLTDAEVTRAMQLLNMTRKKGSTTAYQAFTPADELGSIERPRIWYDVNTERGTTSAKYEWFVENKLLNRLKRDEPSRVFMHDNFVSHKTDEVYELFYRAGHTVVCRAPYLPDKAPIELVFNMLKNKIRRRAIQLHNSIAGKTPKSN